MAQQLAAGKSPEHAYLGVSLADGTDGARLAAVSAGGPGDDAGLQAGDEIVAIDGKAIDSGDAAASAINDRSPGDKIAVTILRDGRRSTVHATLGSRPG